MRDLKLAIRQLAKSPGFAAVAVLTLAVGIGAATAMFSALRALVVEPFSYPQADRLVHIWSKDGQPLSTPDYFDIQDQAVSYAALGVYTPQPANLGGENAQSVVSVSCTAGVLRAFGVAPAGTGRRGERCARRRGDQPRSVAAVVRGRSRIGRPDDSD